MNELTILGSTGSIGKNTLAIVEKFPDRFKVRALTGKDNVERLSRQVQRFLPDLAVVYDKAGAERLKETLPARCHTDIMYGETGYAAAATHPDVDMVVSAMVGGAGLLPTMAAIRSGKDIALANKETLVMAGDLVMAAAREYNVRILPVDSEHSAIFQCIAGNRPTDLQKIFLTASGGPFLNREAVEFAAITVEDALAHPTWQMGSKISIDSATMMNKGLEVIEARHLFNISHKSIEVLVHPQSIIHSMVAFRDGSVIAQMGIPDMKGAICHALSYPERLPLGLDLPDFAAIGQLTFQHPDMVKFPCLALAYKACDIGGTMPAVLNAANEVAVSAFLERKIGFNQIVIFIEKIMNMHESVMAPQMEDILSADTWARDALKTLIAIPGGKATA